MYSLIILSLSLSYITLAFISISISARQKTPALKIFYRVFCLCFPCISHIIQALVFLLSCSYTGSDWFAQNIHGNSVLNTEVFWLKYLPSNSIALLTTKAICCYLPLCPNHYKDYLSERCLSLQYPAYPLSLPYPLGAMLYTVSANSFYLEKGLSSCYSSCTVSCRMFSSAL